MRSLFAALCGFVAVLALLVALPIGWVATHVADEDGYVDFTASLADDAALRSDLAAVVSDEVVAQSGISESFAAVVQQALTAAAAQVVASPEFDTAWRETQRASHQATFGDTGQGQLVIDLGPVAQVVTQSVTADLPVSLEAPQEVIVPVGDIDQQMIDRVQQTPEQLKLVGGAAAVLAGFALVMARRRAGALAWLGAGTLLVAGLLHLVADRAVPRVIEASATSSFASRAQTLIADAAVASFDDWLRIAAYAGGAVLVAGIAGQVLGRRRYE